MTSYALSIVSEVFLLSKEEWENAITFVPNIPVEQIVSWWLRSPGNNDRTAAFVWSDGGDVHCPGYFVDGEFGVRPAFRIPHLTSEYGVAFGDKVVIGHTICTIIDVDVAFADNIVCIRKFDIKNNSWETSDIKKFINSEEFKELS